MMTVLVTVLVVIGVGIEHPISEGLGFDVFDAVVARFKNSARFHSASSHIHRFPNQSQTEDNNGKEQNQGEKSAEGCPDFGDADGIRYRFNG